MHRREFIAAVVPAFGVGSLAGCSGLQPDTDGESATPTATDEPFPDSCPGAPVMEGLPSRPETLTEESVVEFASEFERVYAVATAADVRRLADLDVTNVAVEGDSYRVALAVEAVTATPTPDSDGTTPTPRPTDSDSYRVTYRLQGTRLVRERRGYAAGRLISEDCFEVDTAG